jgi:hypothetical protein
MRSLRSERHLIAGGGARQSWEGLADVTSAHYGCQGDHRRLSRACRRPCRLKRGTMLMKMGEQFFSGMPDVGRHGRTGGIGILAPDCLSLRVTPRRSPRQSVSGEGLRARN